MKLPPVTAFGVFKCVEAVTLSSTHFRIGIDDTTGAVTELKGNDSNVNMNWVSASSNAPWLPLGSRWGLGYADLGEDLLHRTFWTSPEITGDQKEVSAVYEAGPLKLTISRELKDSGTTFTERYVFTNQGNQTLDLASKGKTSLAIYTPFNDHYTNTEDALASRSHAHVWANGGSSAWVKLDQMGGHGHNLGLVLTEGSLAGYSIESRDPITLSNTRGVFLLHPVVPALAPGQSEAIEWSLFWHDTWDDFFDKCGSLSRQFIHFDVPDFTLDRGDNVTIRMKGAVNQNTKVNGAPVRCNGTACSFSHSAGKDNHHELLISTTSNGKSRNASIFLNTVPKSDDLISKRTQYIIQNQQVSAPNQSIDGAYVVYDTQVKAIASWDTGTDRTAGRERLGMGIMMSRWLKKHADNERVRESLYDYYKFVSLELQAENGTVFDRPSQQGRSRFRLYNWPWVLQLHIAVAQLDMDFDVEGKTPVERFMSTLENFYSLGGSDLYAIGLPILEALRFLEDSGHTEEFERTRSLFIEHGETILNRGLDYPPFEVNFEQSIVAPAAVMMLELYRVTGNETYLEAGELQLETLLRFSGRQPDYRAHRIAIRHWDGFWFGKDKHWGDTFPHHWSTLDALALHHYGKAIEDDSHVETAKKIIRSNLALFSPDGRAGCAWIYPLSVNGRNAHYRDPYANDQDWVLNHLLYLEEDEDYTS
ncbi:hypothetical protein F66182_3348 [Fusarium sp. NRRL 66182]|nr:hypothetical protein F66182_3348 [Fusarium sp. NRRL 66182]